MKPTRAHILNNVVLTSLLLCQTHVAPAEENAPTTPTEFSWGGSISLVSDYIWRGQSQTWGGPALQVGIEATHDSGFYGGFWASNVSDQWVPGAQVETDWYAGYRGTLGGPTHAIGYDLNLLYVFYPDSNFDQSGFPLPSSSPNSIEASIALSHDWLSFKTGAVLTRFYGWNTANSGIGAFAGDPGAGVTGSTRGSYFMEANVNYEIAPGWALIGQLGRQTIRNSTGLDWSYFKAGVSHTLGDWSGSLAYSWSSNPGAYQNFAGLTANGDSYDDAKPRWVLSLSRGF